jgi:type I restriction enzyme R subunit
MRTVNILASGITAAFGELVLMEAPAIDLFASFDWGTANLYTESFGKDGTEGRLSESAQIKGVRFNKSHVPPGVRPPLR